MSDPNYGFASTASSVAIAPSFVTIAENVQGNRGQCREIGVSARL